ncbi:MAG: hypothetical protein M1438_09635 [Deltaproteobacteria bacterium]|nr:hypothetical protein [Deltaproteobacteria bacterium]
MQKGDFAEATIVKTIKEVAGHFQVDLATAYRWKKAGMPGLPEGGFDLVQITLWRERSDGKSGGKGKGGGKDAEAERLTRARADRVEFENEVRRGEYVKLVEIEAMLSPRAMAYKQGLVGFRQVLAPRLAAGLGLGPESLRVINAVIDQAAREILDNILRPLTLSSGQVLEWENYGEENGSE